MRLHTVKGDNSFCGPAAISTLTGKPTHEVAKAVRQLTGRVMVKTMYMWEIRKTLSYFGFKTGYRNPPTRKPTLNQWLKDQVPDTTYVLLVTGHFITVRNRHYIDNNVKVLTLIEHYPRKRVRVQQVIEVTNN